MPEKKKNTVAAKAVIFVTDALSEQREDIVEAKERFNKLLEKDFVIFDGALGTELQKRGMKAGEIPEDITVNHPEWLEQIALGYAQAGSDIICANTFGANAYKLAGTPYTVEKAVCDAVGAIKRVTADYDVMIALDIGSIGQLLEPTGTLTFEQAYEIHKQTVLAGVKAGADIIAIETMTDLRKHSGSLAAKENSDLPVICNMTFELTGRTFTGCSVSAMAATLEGLGADAIGVNCSLGPNDLYAVVEELLNSTSLPVVVKPNAGLPDPVTGEYSIDAEMFASYMEKYADMGVKIFGGCCGTSPEYIALMTERLSEKRFVKREYERKSVLCSYCTTVNVNQPRIIGERINPTGKKLFKEALKNNDIDYILKQGIEQVRAGADILDVNVDCTKSTKKQMMIKSKACSPV